MMGEVNGGKEKRVGLNNSLNSWPPGTEMTGVSVASSEND